MPDQPTSVVGAAVAPNLEQPAPKSLAEQLYPNGGEAEGMKGPNGEKLDPATGAPIVEAKTPDPEAPKEPAAPEGEKKPDEPAKEPEAAELSLESYKDLKLPEGFQADEKTLGSFKALALEDKLSPEQAQRYVELGASISSAQSEAIMAQWTKTQKDWTDATLALPEFVGENRKRTEALIGQVMDDFGSPEAREALAITGAGNNPHIARFILNMVNALVEGAPTPQGGALSLGKNGKATPKTLGGLLYGDSPHMQDQQ